MILFLCNDDALAWNAVAPQAGPVFGNAYQLIQNGMPQLGVNENLFIVAHGLPGEIGNQNGMLAWNALELWNYLTNTTPNDRGGSLFPAGYAGNIYVWACYPANITRRDRLSFIENFHAFSRVGLPNSSVYGVAGAVGFAIAPPGNSAWIQVANTVSAV
jgi:hypothetical protein